MKKKNIKKDIGITLIALIITIIVMLILASVTINMAINGGLFENAANAVYRTDLAHIQEEIEMLKITNLISEYDSSAVTNIEEYLLNNSRLGKYQYKLLGGYLIVNNKDVISLTNETAITANESDWYFEIEGDFAKVYGYKGTETDITIPTFIEKEGKKYFVDVLKKAWTSNDFQNKSNITSVEINSNISKIESWIFESCSNLITVKMSSSVTEIGEGVFSNCVKLREVELSKGISVLPTRIFQNDVELEYIELSENITRIGESAFINCNKLKTINLPNKIEAIGKEAFCNCTKLDIVRFPDSLKSIDEKAFINCFSIKKLIMPDSLERIGISAFENVGYNSDIAVLEEIQLNEGLKSIGERAFADARTVKVDLTIPSTVIEEGNEAFIHFGEVGGGRIIRQ